MAARGGQAARVGIDAPTVISASRGAAPAGATQHRAPGLRPRAVTPTRHRLAGSGPVARPAPRASLRHQEAQMEKRARGEIRVRERRDGRLTYTIRFRVDGKRHSFTLGTDRDGWTYRKAERKLEDVLAQVRAGVWKPEAPVRREPVGDQTFHEFASRWWAARKGELRPNTQLDYEWRLRKRLLPFFADFDDCGDRCRRCRPLSRAEGDRAGKGPRGCGCGDPAQRQARAAARPVEQRKHQQNARSTREHPRQRSRTRRPRDQPGPREAPPAQSPSSAEAGTRTRRAGRAPRNCRRDGPKQTA